MKRASLRSGRRSRTAAVPSSSLRTVELLEPRLLLSTYMVTNSSDSGPGSLRQAILDADASSGADVIDFDIPGVGVQTIAPASPLPTVTGQVTIDGRTQPGYVSALTSLQIVLSGQNAGPTTDGLVFGTGASSSVVEGMVINRFGGDGVVLGGESDQIFGCYVGTDATGTVAAGNRGNGVVAGSHSSIGADVGETVISDNGKAGVLVLAGSSDISIRGDVIGTNVYGSAALGNHGEGILAESPVSVSRSVISGNGYSGLVLNGPTGASRVGNSYIGTNAYGTAAIPNGTAAVAPYRDGITVLSGSTTVGPAPMVVSGNRGNGIYAAPGTAITVRGALVGTDFSGTLPLGNGANGIVIAGDHVTLGSANLGVPAPSQVILDGQNIVGGNAADGVLILGSNDTVAAQYVGIGAAGAAVPNGQNGIEIRGGTNDRIGGTLATGSRSSIGGNLISGNGADGVLVHGPAQAGDSISANYIGIRFNGSLPLGNGANGIEFFAGGSTIAGNWVGGNLGSGIYLGPADGTATGGSNTFSNNSVGLFYDLPPAGNGPYGDPLANAGDGIAVVDSDSNIFNNDRCAGSGNDGVEVVGGSFNTFTGNYLAYNAGNGATVRDDPAGANAVGNAFSKNNIYYNGGLRIDLGGDGPTPNDPGDVDSGPNGLQNYPTIVSTSTPINGATTTVHFQLDTRPGTYTIDFVVTPSSNPSGTPNDRDIGTTSITVGADPTTIYSATIAPVLPGQIIVATATGTDGTSEFSPAFSAPPKVLSSAFTFNVPAQPLSFRFDQDVSASITPAALSLHNVETGQDFSAAGVVYDHANNLARFSLPASLPNGHYVATLLASQITNASGQHLDGNGDGIGGDNYTLNFPHLAGDVNGDGTVDFSDLLLLARSYGASFSGADFNGNGTVDFSDLLVLAQDYGQRLPAL